MINTAHMIVAIRRVSPSKNENIGLEKKCYRKLITNDESQDQCISELKEIISNQDGLWRIYKSINKRDLVKANKQLQKDLIDRTDIQYKIGYHWERILRRTECKAERNFLIDIDTNSQEVKENVLEALKTANVTILDRNETPNGYHIVVKCFDTRILKDFDDVEIKKDDLFFLEVVDNNI